MGSWLRYSSDVSPGWTKRSSNRLLRMALALGFLLGCPAFLAGQSGPVGGAGHGLSDSPEDSLPDAPDPTAEVASNSLPARTEAIPMPILTSFSSSTESRVGIQDCVTSESQPVLLTQSTQPGFPPVAATPRKQPPESGRQHPSIPSVSTACLPQTCMAYSVPMTCAPSANAFLRFLNSDVHPLTAKQKARLAWRNATDPFNFLTIGFLSGVSVASDPHSPYGPGWPGFARNFGVAYTETAVSEFFGTFLIPAIAHQDPHYHREPNAAVDHRILHAVVSVIWAQSDTGQGMPNYANLGNTAVGIALDDIYVPGAEQGFGAGAERYVTAIASDPINNLVSEFLPDVARHINVRIVLIQRIVNEVERQNGAG